MNFDVIVVGARCAGATLATLLARSGARVLMLDAQALPGDMPLSTHYIQAPGMEVLDEIGVGAAIRACTPPNRRIRARFDEHDVYVNRPEGRWQYCPRRSTVDPLILKAALDAGATLRDRSRVVDLVRVDGRVSGVVTHTARGEERFHAALVVGADGRNSTIARLTGAEDYQTLRGTRSAYWFYFPAPSIWREDPRYRDWDAYVGWEGDGMRYVFQCDDNLLLMAAAPPAEEFAGWSADYRAATLKYLSASDVTRPLVEATRPLGKGVGIRSIDFYYRRAVGPGFALVGDAGNFKDPVTGHGMTDAFIGAKRLHAAVLEGTDGAYQRYWRERDASTLAWHFDAFRLGEVGVNNPFQRMLFENLARTPRLAARLAAIADRQLSPLQAFSPGETLGMVARALLHGRFDVIRPFLATGRRMKEYRAEVARAEEFVRALAARERFMPAKADSAFAQRTSMHSALGQTS